MADAQSIGKTYEKRPRYFKKDFSWEQSNGIMDGVASAVRGIYIEANVSTQPSTFEKRRYDSMEINGTFFKLALQYVAREGNDKDKVVAQLRPIGSVDYKFAKLDEVVRAAMR